MNLQLQITQKKCEVANYVRDFLKTLSAKERLEVLAMITIDYDTKTGEIIDIENI